MIDKVFLHVGPMKTGSTYVQRTLDQNREPLAKQGVVIPGGTRTHMPAVLDVFRTPRDGEISRVPGLWRQLMRQLRAADAPTGVISCELLSRASKSQIDRIVDSLAPAEVHVVFMARDLSKLIPGMWQTFIRNTGSVTWETYLATVRGDADVIKNPGRRFWQQQDPRLALGRWERRVPRERIHVVTVPPSGTDPAVLWQRFCAVIGVDPATCSMEDRRTNESLGGAEIELLRRINAKVPKSLDRPVYNDWVRRFIARGILQKRVDQRRFALPEQENTWVRPRAEEISEFLQTCGYNVVGDTRDLLPGPVPESAHAPDDVDVEDVLDAAVDVITGLLRKAASNGGSGGGGQRGATGTARAVLRPVVARARGALGRRTGLPARWRSRR